MNRLIGHNFRIGLLSGLMVVCIAAVSVHAAGKGGVLANDMRTPMSASTAPQKAEPPAQHAQTHVDIDKALVQQESLCYQKFAVNACLTEARMQARTERAAADAAQQSEKAAARSEASQTHQAERAQRLEDHDATRENPAAQSDRRKDGRPKSAPKINKASSETDVQRIRLERAAAQAQRDERASRARTRLVEKRAAAQRRQEGLERRRQEREAQGKPVAQPLPAAQ